MAFESKLFWENTKDFNREMRNAARRGSRKLKNNLNEMGAVYSRELINHVGYATRSRHGEIYALKWKTKRYGIILEHGSGRGWLKGVKVSGGSGTTGRKPKPWISDAMQDIVPDVANTAARLKGDDMVDSTDKEFRRIWGQTNYKTG